MIRFIAAIDDKRGLAIGRKIPWKLPTDVAYYHEKTQHSVVLMGLNTYELYSNPLSDKLNYVAIPPGTELRPGYIGVEDPAKFLHESNEDVWVVGGGMLFRTTIEEADELYLTRVKGDFNCDVFFPPFEDSFILTEQKPQQEENGFKFQFEIWRRK